MTKTLRQIAEIAQVSVSTASRALNGHPGISRDTVEKVQHAAQRLSYRPRRSHRRLDASRCLS
ncbi:MAG: LacI family DNA-binding transcriptional regulator, partial [Pirellulales bacterium]|nr:LacI family DNA-binding transcriptional regulator [Pirellulales bacterium]